MDCYLCGRKSGSVAVADSYVVCGVCAETGTFCDSCDKPLLGTDERHEVLGPWDVPTGRFDCEGCAENAFEWYRERMVMS
jgi:hypothetical protein